MATGHWCEITQCMMTQKCPSACNTHYDLRYVASYQPPPYYFYPTEKIRASMSTGHWCEITQNTVPRLASSPRQNPHMQCQPHGRVYNVISNFSNHTWSMDNIAVWNNEAKQCLTDGSPNWLQILQRSIPEAAWEKKSVPCKRGHRPHHQPCFPPVLQIKKRKSSLARTEAKTSTSDHGTISSLN